MTYDIVIPHFGRSEALAASVLRCLSSIAKHSEDYRVILVDNGSTCGVEAVHHALRQLPHMLIRNSENLGFVKATNQGLAYSNAPFVILMNNDTEAAPGWLEKLCEPFRYDALVGISGPLTTAAACWQGKYPGPRDGFAVLPPGRMLAFFCSMLSRKCLAKVGRLDEDFGVGFGDDDNYCLRAERAGFRLALVRSLTIPHAHRTTFREVYGAEAIPAMQEAALELFHRKRREGR